MSEDTSPLAQKDPLGDISALVDSFDYLYAQARMEILPKIRPVLPAIAPAKVVEGVLDSESSDSACNASTSIARSGTFQYDSPPEASPSNGDADQPGAFLLNANMKSPLPFDKQPDHLVDRGLPVSDYGMQSARLIRLECCSVRQAAIRGNAQPLLSGGLATLDATHLLRERRR